MNSIPLKLCIWPTNPEFISDSKHHPQCRPSLEYRCASLTASTSQDVWYLFITTAHFKAMVEDKPKPVAKTHHPSKSASIWIKSFTHVGLVFAPFAVIRFLTRDRSLWIWLSDGHGDPAMQDLYCYTSLMTHTCIFQLSDWCRPDLSLLKPFSPPLILNAGFLELSIIITMNFSDLFHDPLSFNIKSSFFFSDAIFNRIHTKIKLWIIRNLSCSHG